MADEQKPASAAEAKLPAVMRTEIASVVRNIFHPYVGQMMLPNDDTLLMRGGIRSYRIYDDTERDGRVYSCMQKRKLALVSYPWIVDPASQSEADKEVAQLVTDVLSNFNFKASVMDQMDAVLKGFAVGEVMWGVKGDLIVVEKIIARDQRRFDWDIDYKLRMKTFSNMVPGEELPERKFVTHRFGAKDGNPYGLGLGTRLYWYAFFKRQGLTFWLAFADKFGSPTPVGKYPSGAEPADQQKLLAALEALAQEAAVAIPEGLQIELLEAQRSGTADAYDKLLRYLDEQIAEIILGETLSTNLEGGGSLAASETHNGVRLELSQADGDLLAETFNESLIRWIVDFNRPGAAYPKLRWDVNAGEDLKVRADRDKTISDMGFDPSEKYINDTYGGEWTKKAPQPVPPQFGLPPEDDADFAEFVRRNDARIARVLFAERDPDTVDHFAERVGNDGAPAIGAMVGKVKELLDQATSLEDFRNRLIDVYPKISPAAFSEIMGRAVMASDLAGRFEAKDKKNG